MCCVLSLLKSYADWCRWVWLGVDWSVCDLLNLAEVEEFLSSVAESC